MLTPLLRKLQLLFDVERQLDHSFRNLLGSQPRKILKYQFLNIESDQVAQLQRAAACGKNEISMTAVHHNQVARCIESRTPAFPSSPVKCVARQTSRVDRGSTDSRVETVRNSDQRFACGVQIRLRDSHR